VWRVVVVVALVFFADLPAQQMERILNAMNANRQRIAKTMPMKYGVESCELAAIGLSVEWSLRRIIPGASGEANF
jgi:hypothetical protein